MNTRLLSCQLRRLHNLLLTIHRYITEHCGLFHLFYCNNGLYVLATGPLISYWARDDNAKKLTAGCCLHHAAISLLHIYVANSQF